MEYMGAGINIGGKGAPRFLYFWESFRGHSGTSPMEISCPVYYMKIQKPQDEENTNLKQ